MDAELKQILDRIETRPNTMAALIAESGARIMERMDGLLYAVGVRLKDFVREADRDLETKIVGEFWKWGRTSDLWTGWAIENITVFGERVLAVEERISALERRPS